MWFSYEQEQTRAGPLSFSGDLQKGPRFEAIRIPWSYDSSDIVKAVNLFLFNTGDDSEMVLVQLVDQRSGALVSSTAVSLEGRQITSVDLSKTMGVQLTRNQRIRIEGSSPNLQVRGSVVTQKDEVMDITLHSALNAHKSGTYPIPDLSQHEVITSIINLGNAPSTIAAQYFWDGGTFAVPIISIPPQGYAEINPQALLNAATQDMLHRKLDRNAKHLLLKWMVWSGSQDLIGRTIVRPLVGNDEYGFNCGSCCWQIPEADMQPSGEVEVGMYESVALTSVIYWDTCSGMLGPWYVQPNSMSVPWPFSWDSQTLTTADGSEDFIGFEKFANGSDYLCRPRSFDIWGWIKGKACDKVYNPRGYDDSKQCTVQTNTCDQCNSCCEALYNTKLCKKQRPDLALSELNACRGNCLTDRC